jgi:hypothetical protein
MVPSAPGLSRFAASWLVTPITPTFTLPILMIVYGATHRSSAEAVHSTLSFTFFRFAETNGKLARSIIWPRCSSPESKLWLPRVSARTPSAFIARTAGSSSKKLDSGGVAPKESPAMSTTLLGCASFSFLKYAERTAAPPTFPCGVVTGSS